MANRQKYSRIVPLMYRKTFFFIFSFHCYPWRESAKFSLQITDVQHEATCEMVSGNLKVPFAFLTEMSWDVTKNIWHILQGPSNPHLNPSFNPLKKLLAHQACVVLQNIQPIVSATKAFEQTYLGNIKPYRNQFDVLFSFI